MSSERPVRAKSFPCALYLLARGHEPLAAERSPDGRPVWLFDPAAQTDLGSFLRAKEALNDLAAGALS
jgi:hypothetical protein